MTNPRQSETYVSEAFHGECCDECGQQISHDGNCKNCEEKQELEQELKNIYFLGELPDISVV